MTVVKIKSATNAVRVTSAGVRSVILGVESQALLSFAPNLVSGVNNISLADGKVHVIPEGTLVAHSSVQISRENARHGARLYIVRYDQEPFDVTVYDANLVTPIGFVDRNLKATMKLVYRDDDIYTGWLQLGMEPHG